MPTISQLPIASAVNAGDLFVIVQGGITKQATDSLVIGSIQSTLIISQSQVTGLTSALAGKLAISANLSDLNNAATARTNLGFSALTNGQLWIGSTGTDPVAASLTAGTGISITGGVGTITIDADIITSSVVSGNIPIFSGTDGLLEDSGIAPASLILTSVDAGQTISSSTNSATPGTIRALHGEMTTSATVMTSGNLVGIRGSVTMVGASGGFVYGTQGKVIASGTISSSVWVAPIFGQLDVSAATITDGQLAPVWADYGTTATSGTYTGARMFAGTNTTAAILNSQIYLYGGATNFLELSDNNGLVGPTYITTPAGSTPGGNLRALTVSINGATYKILAAETYT